MIDIHTHILPAVDDGAEDMDTALLNLKVIQESGVTDLFLTPHYIPGEYESSNIFNYVSCKLLGIAAREQHININLHCGIELYLTDEEEKDADFTKFRMEDSDYVLVETGMNGFPVNFREILYLMVKKGFKPVLAHPERYYEIMQDISIAEELIYRNVYLQANAGSFLGLYGNTIAKTAWDIFEKGYYHFIASDHHCRNTEYTMSTLRLLLSEYYSNKVINLLMYENPARLLRNEKIKYFNPKIHSHIKGEERGNLIQQVFRLFSNG